MIRAYMPAMVLTALWLASFGCAQSAAPGGGSLAASDALYELALRGALPGDKPLALRLDVRGGAVHSAFAEAPTFNRASHEVDASGLKAAGEDLRGLVRVTVHSDGYVPAGDAAASCRYHIEARRHGRAVRGSFAGHHGGEPVSGAVEGRLMARPPEREPAHVELMLDNAAVLPRSRHNWHRRLTLRFGLRDGRAFAPRLEPPGSPVDTGFAARVTSADLSLADGRLSGTLAATLTPNGKAPLEFVWELSAAAVGGRVGGGFRTFRDGEPVGEGRLLGTVYRGPKWPAPADGVTVLTLHDAVEPGRYVKLFLRAGPDGVRGFATTPNFNNATHELSGEGLRFADGKLRGRVDVVVHPDPWVPPDGEPVACSYRLDATYDGVEVTGTYEGTFGGQAVSGALHGGLRPVVSLSALRRATLKLENALTGGNAWQNRAFLSVELDGGHVVGGRASNNHTDLEGRVTGGSLTVEDGRLRGRVTAEVAPSGGVRGGAYAFEVDGICAGELCAGSFRGGPEGGERKTGRFWASLTPATGESE
jgi:hypothetical protein